RHNLAEMSQTIAEYNKAKDSLQVGEGHYRGLYEDNPSMYFTVDLEGKILSVNKLGAEELGYATEELIGQSLFNFF
ncbi:PAS domain S-box protein, partial [Vibrio cholerae]|nr:PAS domain S-box protein [Vibrio cholerae]